MKERTMQVGLLDSYQRLASRTLNVDLTDNEKQAMLALGIAGEAGEVADYMKKVLFHGQPLDREKIKKELGDVLWYLSGLALQLGIEMSEVATENIAKLKLRYPNGFNSEDSIKRADGEQNDQDCD